MSLVTPGQPARSRPRANRLSFATERNARPLIITAELRNPDIGPVWSTLDMMAPRPAEVDTFAPLRQSMATMPDGTRTGLCGFSLPRSGGQPPISFTLSVIVADTSDADGIGGPDAQVQDFVLAGHPGRRHAQLTLCPAPAGATVPLLCVSYIADTPYGTVLLTLATGQVDAADIFATLFDAVAGSLSIASVDSPVG